MFLKVIVLTQSEWLNQSIAHVYDHIEKEIGFPCVIRPANQGSSIGVSILNRDAMLTDVEAAVHKSFFCYTLDLMLWKAKSEDEKIQFIQQQSDIREGIGLPMKTGIRWIYKPSELYQFIENSKEEKLFLEGKLKGVKLLLNHLSMAESFLALSYETTKAMLSHFLQQKSSKASNSTITNQKLPGLSRKVTPIEINDNDLQRIRTESI